MFLPSFHPWENENGPYSVTDGLDDLCFDPFSGYMHIHACNYFMSQKYKSGHNRSGNTAPDVVWWL